MDTPCPEIGADDMLEFCLMPWMAFAEEDITAAQITTAGKVSHLLVSSKRFEVFENFIFNLHDRVLRVFLKNERFRRCLIALRHRQERYEEICDLIKGGIFADGTDLLEMWDNANYKMWERQYRKSLSALTRFRIRKRNPPPPSICQEGRKTRCLDHSARAVMTEWLLEHSDHPYPNFTEREQIAQKTGLSHTQIKTWFANARRRKQLHEKRLAREAKEMPKRTKSKVEERTSSEPSLKEKWKRSAAGSHHEDQQTRTTVRCMISQLQAPSPALVDAGQESPGLQGLLCMYNKLTTKTSSPSSLPPPPSTVGTCVVHSYPSVQLLRHQPSSSRYHDVNSQHRMPTAAERNSWTPQNREATVTSPIQSHQASSMSNPICAGLDRKSGPPLWTGNGFEPDVMGPGRIQLESTGHGNFFASPSVRAPTFQKQVIPTPRINVPVGPLALLQYSSTRAGILPAAPETSRATIFDAMSVSSVLNPATDLATASMYGRAAAPNLIVKTEAVSLGMMADGGECGFGDSSGGRAVIRDQCKAMWNASTWFAAQNPLQAPTSSYCAGSSQDIQDMVICSSQDIKENQMDVLSSPPGYHCGEFTCPQSPETILVFQPSYTDCAMTESLPEDRAGLNSLLTGNSTVPSSQEDQSSGHMDEIAAQLLLNLAHQTSDDKHPLKQ